MGDTERLGDQPITGLDHVTVAIVREVSLKPVGGFARSAAPNGILHDYEILRRIEWLAQPEQLVRKARTQPIGTRAGIALQQQHAVRDLARGVTLWGSHCSIMQLQLGQCLAAAENIMPDDEVALVVIQPFRGVRTHSVSPCARALAFSICRKEALEGNVRLRILRHPTELARISQRG